jgi:starvation-inducible outer membrane lipoprotein
MYKIRRNEKFTQCHVSQVITLDPERFRQISIPYEGNTELEFLKYISENLTSFEDISNEFSEDTWNLIKELIYPDWKLEWCSTRKWGNYWYDTVDEVTEDRVEVRLSTYDNVWNG